jgi:hypothetical protein
MLRLSEIGLFLVPFALYVTWWFAGPRMPPAVLWAAMGLLLILAASTAWYGLHERMDADEVYVPAHMENGQVVPGHGVPRVHQ